MNLGETSAVTAKRTVGYVGLMTEKGRKLAFPQRR
jgi:hypothetical protein